MKKLFLISVFVSLFFFLYTPALAEVPQMINYQGKLTNATGAPVNDTLQMIFSIYSDEGGTNLLWTEDQDSVVVEKGVFNVLLGSVDSIPYSVFDGSIRYLGVKVGDDPEITPRKPMVTVAYAYKSFEADTADYARGFSGTVENADKVDGFHASSAPTPGYLYPLDGSAKIPNARLYTGSGNGLDADLLDGQHAGAFALSGHNHFGQSWSGTGSLNGLVVENNFSTTDTRAGLKGVCNGSGALPAHAIGVFGDAHNTGAGEAVGGWFQAGPEGSGLRLGVNGITDGGSSQDHTGVHGLGKNTSNGNAYGGYFETYYTGTGDHYGVYSLSENQSPAQSVGVYGHGKNTSSGSAYGGYFETYFGGTGYHVGVCGRAQGSSNSDALGIEGWASNSSSGPAFGGYFWTSPMGTGTQYGVYATALGGANYAGYFLGNFLATGGTKSAAVKVDNGEYRLLYCQESTENWFEDFGKAQLTNGVAKINIDPLYAQTVNTSIDYHVFPIPEGDCKGLFVTNKTPTSFEIKELQGGTSNIPFSYRIVAKRKGYENLRLEKMAGPTPEEIMAERARHQAELEQEKARMEEERVKREKEKELR